MLEQRQVQRAGGKVLGIGGRVMFQQRNDASSQKNYKFFFVHWNKYGPIIQGLQGDPVART